MQKSLGLIETMGLTTGITAADAAMKSANVTLVGYEFAKGSGRTVIKVEGDVGAVKASIDAAKVAALKVGGVASTKVIARPSSYLEPMIRNELTVGYNPTPEKKEDPIKEPIAEPVDEVKTESVEEPTPEPVKEEPVEEPKAEPVDEVTTESVEEIKEEPVKEVTPEPVKPEPVEPVETKSTQEVADTVKTEVKKTPEQTDKKQRNSLKKKKNVPPKK